MVSFPDLAKKLKFRLIPKYISDFFINVVDEVIEHREKSPIERNDFMNLLLQLKNTGVLTNDSGEKEKIGSVTMDEIAAQTFVFFLGGFETSSTTAMFCLHELSLNQDIQEKARNNVLDILEKYGGKLTYEGLSELNYLEQCINGNDYFSY
jgi:cytochrome P450 family 6